MRLVFDLRSDAFIYKHFYLDKGKNKFYRLVIDLKRIKQNKQSLKSTTSKRKKKKFIITIDPGHGGIDPGAINLGKKEKDITLKASIELKKMLDRKYNL